MKTFSDWCDKRRIDCDLHSLSPTELSGILRRSYAEIKKTKKKKKTEKGSHPKCLTGIRAAIHHKITSQPISRAINILKDGEFLQENRMFEDV